MTHFTDDLGQVPENQRAKSETESKKGPQGEITIIQDTGPAAPASGGAGSDGVKPKAATSDADVDDEGHGRDYWQGRLHDTREQLKKAQGELQSVHEEQLKNLESGPGIQERKAQLATQEQSLKTQIDSLQRQLDTGIPQEARQAGAPPGWLR